MIHFKEAVDGRHYFTLVANNHEPISLSQMYDTKQSMKSGAEAVLKCAGEYWKEAFATLIEEKAQSIGEEENRLISIPEISRLLLSMTNEDMQKIIDRIPYDSK